MASMKDSVYEMRQKISDYPWAIGEYVRLKEKVQQLQNELENEGTNVNNSSIGSGLPAGLGSFSKISEFDSRQSTLNKFVKRLGQMELLLKEVYSLTEHVFTDKEWVVLYCRLDGMTIKWISEHLSVSRRTVYRIIDDIIKRYLQKEGISTIEKQGTNHERIV